MREKNNKQNENSIKIRRGISWKWWCKDHFRAQGPLNHGPSWLFLESGVVCKALLGASDEFQAPGGETHFQMRMVRETSGHIQNYRKKTHSERHFFTLKMVRVWWSLQKWVWWNGLKVWKIEELEGIEMDWVERFDLWKNSMLDQVFIFVLFENDWFYSCVRN